MFPTSIGVCKKLGNLKNKKRRLQKKKKNCSVPTHVESYVDLAATSQTPPFRKQLSARSITWPWSVNRQAQTAQRQCSKWHSAFFGCRRMWGTNFILLFGWKSCVFGRRVFQPEPKSQNPNLKVDGRRCRTNNQTVNQRLFAVSIIVQHGQLSLIEPRKRHWWRCSNYFRWRGTRKTFWQKTIDSSAIHGGLSPFFQLSVRLSSCSNDTVTFIYFLNPWRAATASNSGSPWWPCFSQEERSSDFSTRVYIRAAR